MVNRSTRVSLISPKFCLDSHEFKALVNEFGPHSGRFIDKVPHDWLDILREWVDTEIAKPLEKARLTERINQIQLKGYLIPKKQSETPISWEQAVEEAQQKPETYEFTIGDALDPSPFSSWEATYDEIVEGRNIQFFYKSIEDILFYFLPLIQNAKFIYIVDPYFNPFDPTKIYQKEFLVRVLQQIKFHNCYYLSIVTHQTESNNLPVDLVEQTEAQFEHLMRNNLRLHWHLLSPEYFKTGKKLHDRYLITDKGSLILGNGIVNSRKSRYTISFAQKAKHDGLIEEYVRPFDKLINQKTPKRIEVNDYS